MSHKRRIVLTAVGALALWLTIGKGEASGRTLSANFPTERPGLIVRDDAGTILLQPSQLPGSFFYRAGGRTYFPGPITTRRREAGGGWTATAKTHWPDRTATISMQRASHGGVVVTFYVSDMESVRELGFAYQSPASEYIHGLTERVVDGPDEASWQGLEQEVKLDRRGERVSMYVRPSVSMYAPFYITSRGYGIYVETTWPGSYDLAASVPETILFSFEGPRLVFHIFPGPTAADVLNQYTALTGRPLVPLRWACLVWRRNEHRSVSLSRDGDTGGGGGYSRVYDEVAKLEKLDIACGVYCMDGAIAEGSAGLEKMSRWLKGKGYRVLVEAAPFADSKAGQQARERGFLAPNSDKVVDLTNPDAMRWLVDVWQERVDRDASGFLLDFPEERIPSERGDIYFDKRSGRELHNLYPVLCARAFHAALREKLADEFVIVPRSGFAGSQQFAVFRAGNSPATPAALRSAIISAQRIGLLGMPFWGSETGGTQGNPDREVLSRWLAFSCFTPIMIVRGGESRDPWQMAAQPHYDEELVAIYRYFAKLHTLLADYTYTHAKQAHLTGAPIVRPLFYQYPDDETCWRRWDEFLYGSDILVAPIWERGRREREVYLPEGRWINYWNEKERYEGQKTVEVEAPLSRIPIFLREGHTVPVLHTEKGPALRRAM